MSAAEDKSWRIKEASYLRGQRFALHLYDPGDRGHDHCAACFVTFCEIEGYQANGMPFQTEGYVTSLDSDPCWVCKACFSLIRDDLEWTLGG